MKCLSDYDNLNRLFHIGATTSCWSQLEPMLKDRLSDKLDMQLYIGAYWGYVRFLKGEL